MVIGSLQTAIADLAAGVLEHNPFTEVQKLHATCGRALL
jgi:hypothetical protein